MFETVVLKYLSLKDYDGIEQCKGYDRTIESFSSCDCKIFFEFKKAEEIFQLLPFPDICKFDNRSEMTGEEVFLRGLYDLVNGEAKHNISRNVFG